jgi:RND family efflux transporter MFP subunit
MKLNRKALWGLVCALLALGAGFWWFKGGDAPAKADFSQGAKAAQSVTLYTVVARDLPLQIEATGNVVALNTVEMRPQTSTTVRRIAIREGQFVRPGDLLFTFDDRPDQANLEKAKAALLRDQASLADLERQWRRAQDLRAQNFIAQSAADTVLSQWEAQKALVASSEAGVRAAEVSASYGSLRAPLAGQTGLITVNPGSLVQPTGAALVTISQIDPIAVSFQLPETDVSALLAGRGAAAEGLPLLVTRPASAGQPALVQAGKLRFMDNTVDPTSGTIKLKGELPNAQRQFWPGQYVSVRLTLATLKDAIVVPQAALILRGQERQVYGVDAEGKAQLKSVRVRQNVGDWAVVDGLAVGERVVLDGKQNLRPGTPVKEAVKASKPGVAAPAASGASA